MYKYKLKDEYSNNGERIFPGVGITEEGFITSATPVESPLLELVKELEQAPTPATPETTPVPVQAVTNQPAPSPEKES